MGWLPGACHLGEARAEPKLVVQDSGGLLQDETCMQVAAYWAQIGSAECKHPTARCRPTNRDPSGPGTGHELAAWDAGGELRAANWCGGFERIGCGARTACEMRTSC